MEREEKYLRVSVAVENQPGAGGKIAFEKFQKTEPDGNSLVGFTFPKSIIIEYMEKTNFSTKDFTPIFALCYSNQILVVHTESWKTFHEFLNAAKAKNLSGGLSDWRKSFIRQLKNPILWNGLKEKRWFFIL